MKTQKIVNGLLQLFEITTFDEPQALMMNNDTLIIIKNTSLPVYVDPLTGIYTVFGITVIRANYLPTLAIGIMEESAAKAYVLINNSGYSQTLEFISNIKQKLQDPGVHIFNDIQYIVIDSQDLENDIKDNTPINSVISKGVRKQTKKNDNLDKDQEE